jgi:hypothetical protein
VAAGDRRRRVLAVGVVVVAALVPHRPPQQLSLPIRPTGEIALPGDSSRFDYGSLDADRGLLFVAHLGASQIIEIDVHAGTVVRTIPPAAPRTASPADCE